MLTKENLNHNQVRNAHQQYPTFINELAKAACHRMLSRMPLGRLDIARTGKDSIVLGNAETTDAKIFVHNDDFFTRCVLFGDLGLAESYLDGLCDLESIRSVISWFLLNNNDSTVLNETRASLSLNLLGLVNKLVHLARPNSERKSKDNIRDHYDLGNDFFSLFLDPQRIYSCALFNSPSLDLASAQQAKLQRIASQLDLKSSDEVLEIGCGWGALSIYIAKNFGCRVTAITISKEQLNYVRRAVSEQGLADLVKVEFMDYRKVQGRFDKVVSIEMIEAVGEAYLDEYFSCIQSVLKPDGLLLLQMIVSADCRYETLTHNVDFIQKHIFPGSLLPSIYRVATAMRRTGDLNLIDMFDMTASYVSTLEHWQRGFEQNLESVRKLGFDERFVRKWKYYFEYCQAAFDMRHIGVVQATYSRPNNLRLQGVQRVR